MNNISGSVDSWVKPSKQNEGKKVSNSEKKVEKERLDLEKIKKDTQEIINTFNKFYNKSEKLYQEHSFKEIGDCMITMACVKRDMEKFIKNLSERS